MRTTSRNSSEVPCSQYGRNEFAAHREKELSVTPDELDSRLFQRPKLCSARSSFDKWVRGSWCRAQAVPASRSSESNRF